MIEILRSHGVLIIAVPISGFQRIEFDAHRVFNVETVVNHCMKRGLSLVEFAYVDDRGDLNHADLPFDLTTRNKIFDLKYGCGCFVFRKMLTCSPPAVPR